MCAPLGARKRQRRRGRSACAREARRPRSPQLRPPPRLPTPPPPPLSLWELRAAQPREAGAERGGAALPTSPAGSRSSPARSLLTISSSSSSYSSSFLSLPPGHRRGPAGDALTPCPSPAAATATAPPGPRPQRPRGASGAGPAHWSAHALKAPPPARPDAAAAGTLTQPRVLPARAAPARLSAPSPLLTCPLRRPRFASPSPLTPSHFSSAPRSAPSAFLYLPQPPRLVSSHWLFLEVLCCSLGQPRLPLAVSLRVPSLPIPFLSLACRSLRVLARLRLQPATSPCCAARTSLAPA